MKTFKFTVAQDDEGVRLDVFLAEKLAANISRSIVKKHIAKSRVTVNSRLAKPSTKLHFQNVICLEMPEEEETSLTAQPMPLNIVYEDDCLLVLDKPVNLSVHPGAGNRSLTLVNALIAYTDKLSTVYPQRPGIVHRLDKDTSGLLILAKNNHAHLNLARQFKQRKVKKIYLAVVEGEVQFDEGEINAPIAPDKQRRRNMKVDFAARRDALTKYKVLKRLKKFTPLENASVEKSARNRKSSLKSFTVVELSPVTGRTHQLRVHMKYIGHPILGDKKYRSHFPFSRLALHAKSLRVRHPETNEVLEFNSPLPQELAYFLK